MSSVGLSVMMKEDVVVYVMKKLHQEFFSNINNEAPFFNFLPHPYVVCLWSEACY